MIERFDGRGDCLLALDRLLAVTGSRLTIFDTDLQALELDRPQRSAQIARILSSARVARLELVVHQVRALEALLPRLRVLMRQYGHAAEARQTPEHLCHLSELFVIGDERHLLVRFHADWPRGKLLLDEPDEVAGWHVRFSALWQECVPVAASTPLGL